MKNNRKLFFLIEASLAVMVIALAFIMILEKNGEDFCKVSVIVQDSDDNQWSAFRYGLKMAAEDQGVELFVVSTGNILTVEEEIEMMNREIDHGADALIVQPVVGTDSESMMNRMKKKVPVMLVEHTASKEQEVEPFPAVKPDHYEMGKTLAEELLKDYNGNLAGKTMGIIAENNKTEAVYHCRQGFYDALEDTGVKICWSVSASAMELQEKSIEDQPEVDLVIALDNSSLITTAECSAANNLHGALVYGIGNSTEAVYYLDTGIVECLLVPDEFSIGYQSLTKTAECLGSYFRKLKGSTVTYTVIRREDLFSKKNQELLFTMSQ